MTLVSSSVTKTTKWLPFLLLSNTVHEYPRKIIPTSKVWNPNSRNFFPRNLKNPKSAKLNSNKNLLPHGFRRFGNSERANWMRLYPDFNNHVFGNCVNFSGKKVTVPPNPKVTVRLCLRFLPGWSLCASYHYKVFAFFTHWEHSTGYEFSYTFHTVQTVPALFTYLLDVFSSFLTSLCFSFFIYDFSCHISAMAHSLKVLKFCGRVSLWTAKSMAYVLKNNFWRIFF